MGFADGYLQKHGIGQPLIKSAPNHDLHSIIAIPAYNESGLKKCLDSLFLCDRPDDPVEVIVLINSGVHTHPGIIDLNRKVHADIEQWCHAHQSQGLTFHAVLLENLPKKHFGAGLARKLVMDEAVRRFNQLDHAMGIIFSLDADTTVEQNYLREVTGLLDRAPETDGCSIRFAHPVGGEWEEWRSGRTGQQESIRMGERESGRVGERESERVGERESIRVGERESGREQYTSSVYEAIVNYELHQRYYLEAVRFTGYPNAFHTVGSAFTVRAGAYCRQGGMSKRQAGEDFYFIQKVAMLGNYTECNTTTVYPSPRPSDRVPFGTGPAISRQLETPGKPYLTYAPILFQHLQDIYGLIPDFFAVHPGSKPTLNGILSSLPVVLRNYLESTDFLSAIAEIHRNVASEKAFRQRFFRKFNMFWILKYLHFAQTQGVDRVEVGSAASELLVMKKEQDPHDKVLNELLLRKGKMVLSDRDLRELLAIYRQLQAVPPKK